MCKSMKRITLTNGINSLAEHFLHNVMPSMVLTFFFWWYRWKYDDTENDLQENTKTFAELGRVFFVSFVCL